MAILVIAGSSRAVLRLRFLFAGGFFFRFTLFGLILRPRLILVVATLFLVLFGELRRLVDGSA